MFVVLSLRSFEKGSEGSNFRFRQSNCLKKLEVSNNPVLGNLRAFPMACCERLFGSLLKSLIWHPTCSCRQLCQNDYDVGGSRMFRRRAGLPE